MQGNFRMLFLFINNKIVINEYFRNEDGEILVRTFGKKKMKMYKLYF